MGMLQKPFGDLITFTRLSAAGYWNWQAVYTMAAANEPRINHDPATLSISETSVTLGAGEHTFATNHLYVVGTVLRASADADNWMTGRVIAASEGSVTIAVTGVQVRGSGTYTSWTLIVRLGIRVEEQRTNLLTYSSDFANAAWTKGLGVVLATDDMLAPDGSVAQRVDLASDIRHELQKGVPPLAVGTTYTLSIWVRPKTTPFPFQLGYYDGGSAINANQPTPVAGKWTRISYTFTPTRLASNPLIRLVGYSNGADGDSLYIWGAQLEAGSFPTSLIHTEGSQVTRAADIASVNDLAPWYNPEQGTLFVEWAHISELVPAGTAQYVVGLFGGNAVTDFVNIQRNASEVIQGLSSVGGVDQGPIDAKLAADTRSHRAAMSVSADGRYISVDGSSVLTGPQTATPVFDRMFIGNRWDGIRATNGHIRSIRVYPRAMPDQLQALTA